MFEKVKHIFGLSRQPKATARGLFVGHAEEDHPDNKHSPTEEQVEDVLSQQTNTGRDEEY